MGNWGFCTIERVVKCNENRREKERKHSGNMSRTI